MTRRVGLTGGIATGKSYVAQRLRRAGVPVVDADVLAREAVDRGSAGLDSVVARFGAGMLGPDGRLNRGALGRVVFADATARHDLEAIIHPLVRSGIDAFFAALPAETPFAVADIPLLFETNRAGDFDAVIVVACSPAEQLARVTARDGITHEEARQRLAAQMPIGDKVRLADYVIRTSGSFADTDHAVDEVVAALRARFP